MNINYKQVAERIYTTLLGSNLQAESYDDKGQLQIDPQDATRFVVDSPEITLKINKNENTIAVDIEGSLSDDPIIKLLKAF